MFSQFAVMDDDDAIDSTSSNDERELPQSVLLAPPLAQRPVREQEFSLQLIYTASKKKKGQGKGGGKKEIRGKDLFFTCTQSNYLDFLKALLDRYGENKYTVTKKQHFPFKYHYPGRTYVKYIIIYYGY
jgi:hypothetical protein